MKLRERLRFFARETLLRRIYPRGLFRINTSTFGTVGSNPALVAMCLWNRPTHFRTMLDNFAAQDYPDGLVIGLWNNDPANSKFYRSVIKDWARAGDTGAVKRIHLTNSPINTGGPGRYYMGRKLVRKYRQPYIIFLDDDQVIGPAWTSDLMSQAQPQTQKSWWGWHVVNDEYWNRVRANPGEEIDYAATCGMIADAAILERPELFQGLPRESWFLEDIWLNHVGVLNGQRLFALDTHMEMVLDDTNQYHKLADSKPAFYRSLVEQRQSL